MVMWVGESGGHATQRDAGWRIRRYGAPRAAPRSMSTGEFMELVYRFLAPPWIGCGVSVRDSRLKALESINLPPAGQIWVATNDQKEFTGVGIPLGELPYENIRTAEFDEDRMRWVGGELRRGWRFTLERLWQKGYLRKNDPELLFILGRARP